MTGFHGKNSWQGLSMPISLRPFFFSCALITAACLLPGCQSSRKVAFRHFYPPGQLPEFWLEYHPYPPEQPANLSPKVRAIPYFDGWTDLRMERDLRRISDAGFSAILLRVTPENMASSIFAERLGKFHQLASKIPVPPAIALVLTPSAKEFTLSLTNTMNFFVNRGFSKLPSALLVEHTAVLFFGENVNLIDKYYGLESYAKINDFLPQVENYQRSSGKAGCRISAAARPLANASAKPENQIASYREKGLYLSKQLQCAFDQQAPIICISSWNNYQNASFIENNSLDQTLMLDILQKAQDALQSENIESGVVQK
jgi:hypothetical protein